MADPRGSYVAPAIDLGAFNCPHCGAYAAQKWFRATAVALTSVPQFSPPLSLARVDGGSFSPAAPLPQVLIAKVAAAQRLAMEGGGGPANAGVRNAFLSVCGRCGDPALWVYKKLLWPQWGGAPVPNPDLSDDVRGDYEEAGTILDPSPRAAAALLRLAIQKLCKELGEKGDNINDDIAALVAKGLPVQVQQALDLVRLNGNAAVHPGELDLRDDRATAASLFDLVNLIAESMISQPKRVAEMYARLPQPKRDQIERRDGPKPKAE